MKVILQKAIFHFSETEGGKHVTWNVFKRDEKATQLLSTSSFCSTNSSQHLVLQRSPTSNHKVTPLDIVEEASFHSLSTSFIIPFKLSMISGSVTKSSLSVDTAFRKDSTLQGCTVSHTYQPTLNATCML